MNTTSDKLATTKAAISAACNNLIIEALANDLANTKVQLEEALAKLKDCSCEKSS